MSDGDIPALVERVRELDAKATPGPWYAVNVAGSPVLSTGKQYTDCAVLGGLNANDCDEQQAKINGELAALYRTAAPVLADEVERLQRELARLHRVLDRHLDARSTGESYTAVGIVVAETNKESEG